MRHRQNLVDSVWIVGFDGVYYDVKMPLIYVDLQYIGLNTAARVYYLTLFGCLDIQYQHRFVAILSDEQNVLIAYSVEKYADIASNTALGESVRRPVNHYEQEDGHNNAYYRSYYVERIVVGLHISHAAKSKNVDNRTYQ